MGNCISHVRVSEAYRSIPDYADILATSHRRQMLRVQPRNKRVSLIRIPVDSAAQLRSDFWIIQLSFLPIFVLNFPNNS